jgi:hypothetical protein
VPLRLYLDVVPVAGCRKRSTSAWMIDAPRRINVDDRRKAILSFPNAISYHDGRRALGLANTVIAHFLGGDWLEAHVLHTAPKPGFLRMDFSSGDKWREATCFDRAGGELIQSLMY